MMLRNGAARILIQATKLDPSRIAGPMTGRFIPKQSQIRRRDTNDMVNSFKPKVLAAHALAEGGTVWLDADGQWTRREADAVLIEDAATADLFLLDAEARGHEVAGAHLVDARLVCTD